VTTKTLEKYLYRLKAWNLFHKKDYPTVSKARVKVMLRASTKEDTEAPTKRNSNTWCSWSKHSGTDPGRLGDDRGYQI
jgi:hypothetical protein